jgi:hypothetical protein
VRFQITAASARQLSRQLYRGRARPSGFRIHGSRLVSLDSAPWLVHRTSLSQNGARVSPLNEERVILSGGAQRRSRRIPWHAIDAYCQRGFALRSNWNNRTFDLERDRCWRPPARPYGQPAAGCLTPLRMTVRLGSSNCIVTAKRRDVIFEAPPPKFRGVFSHAPSVPQRSSPEAAFWSEKK